MAYLSSSHVSRGEMGMLKILNMDDLPPEFVDDPEFESQMKTLYLGAAARSEKLYVNIDYVKPGAKSVKYHSHSKQEEFFLILEGSGTLRMNDEQTPVKKGDFVAKPAGKEIAHQFINDGSDVLRILDCGLNEKDETVTYPDEQVILLKKQRMAFKISDALKDWSSDPNR
jgi:uncharacterized cupin superfamily protein